MMAMERKQSNGPEIDEEGLWVQLACGSSIQLCPTCFWATGRDFIWCASPQLVVSCPMRQPLASNHPRAAKSDKVLRAIASEFCSVAASPRSLVGQLLSIHSV
jgi:hypothetical protein